jgi:hypothetical protein
MDLTQPSTFSEQDHPANNGHTNWTKTAPRRPPLLILIQFCLCLHPAPCKAQDGKT